MKAWLLVVMVLLAGCAGGNGDADHGDGAGLDVDATTGAIQGVVVDEAIRPIKGAAVRLSGPTERNGTTDADGRFAFDALPPGAYLLEVSHPIFSSMQTTTQAVAGDATPPLVRVLLTRLFTQEPFAEAIKFEGFIQCGFDTPFLTSQCVNDYTTILVPGGVANDLRSVVDRRGYVTAVGPGWQVMVYELVWEPSAQGTSEEMFLLASFFNRTSTDQYAQGSGPSPVNLRMTVGETHESQTGTEEQVPAEGRPDLYVFAGIAAGGGLPAGVGFSQGFRVFQTNFYYAIPPADWSFVEGDPMPF
ncbi:MAG: carboxypeptidase-like regulatory domain-containing protein [Candidatus Thermoplasmatota archaeon]|jgi:hypothetical protein